MQKRLPRAACSGCSIARGASPLGRACGLSRNPYATRPAGPPDRQAAREGTPLSGRAPMWRSSAGHSPPDPCGQSPIEGSVGACLSNSYRRLYQTKSLHNPRMQLNARFRRWAVTAQARGQCWPEMQAWCGLLRHPGSLAVQASCGGAAGRRSQGDGRGASSRYACIGGIWWRRRALTWRDLAPAGALPPLAAGASIG